MTKDNGNVTDRMKQIVSDAKRERQKRERAYREKALKMFPWVCGRCGREFSGKKVRELTVHHRDHNHDHNPSDGSNWELLCIYCHENEHSRLENSALYSKETPGGDEKTFSTHRPFAGLDELLKKRK